MIHSEDRLTCLSPPLVSIVRRDLVCLQISMQAKTANGTFVAICPALTCSFCRSAFPSRQQKQALSAYPLNVWRWLSITRKSHIKRADVTCTPSVLDKVILAIHAGAGWQWCWMFPQYGGEEWQGVELHVVGKTVECASWRADRQAADGLGGKPGIGQPFLDGSLPDALWWLKNKTQKVGSVLGS